MPEYSATETLQDIWWIAAVAFGVSLVATPLVRLAAYRAKIVDRPDELLKPHARPVAYLGGIAICLALLVGLGCYLMIMPGAARYLTALKADLRAMRIPQLLRNPIWNLAAIALGSIVITIVGLMDDVFEIAPRQKVLGQVIAAGILLAGGVGDSMATVVFSILHLYPPAWLLVPISALMCVSIVIATCNATNLIDGLDGLCGGVTGIIAVGFLALAVWLAMWNRFPGTDGARVALCLAMAGAVLGFLPYNVPPASIFMGDAGSMLLGFFVAAMMAMFCQEGTARWFVAAWAVFALPTLDTGLAVIRRIISGKSIFAGDRSHLYDQLVDRGMTVRQVVVLFYALAIVAATGGVVVAIYVRGLHAVAMYSLLLVVMAIFGLRLGFVSPEPRRPGAGPAADGHEDS